MPIHYKLSEEIKNVDLIIGGGGTAACVVAGRLASGNPDLKILMIEGGTNNHNVESIIHPALFPEHVAEGSRTAIFYKTNKQPQLANREPIVPSGGTLGGGSSINLMLYTRAQRADFDDFNTRGWAADDMLYYLNRFETYHGPGDKAKHGDSGPTQVSGNSHRVKRSEDDFIQAAGKVGYPEIRDLQDLDSCNGVQRWLRYVSPSGKRQDAAHCYVHPLLADGKHPNLHVLVEHKVVRVLFDNDKKANGVEFQPNPEYQEGTQKQQAFASKMVVVSCGACGSPPVVERSGVGDPAILGRAGVKVVADNPNVGTDYQDHNLVFFPYKTYLEEHETSDALVNGRLDRKTMIENKESILGWNHNDVAAKLRPTEEEVDELGPAFRKAYDRDFANPNRPLMLMALIGSYLGADTTIDVGQYASVANYTAYPYSRGHIHITGPEVDDPLDFSLGFFTDPDDLDLKKQMWAYKKSREIMRRTGMYRGEVASGHPPFNASSDAAIIDKGKEQPSNVDPPKDVKNLKYTYEDDRVLEQFLRERIETTWHSLGTIKMAPFENGGAVDPDLNVYGVKNLKVVDLSIVPANVAANTMNTALVVGEKASDIIAKELGFKVGHLPPMHN